MIFAAVGATLWLSVWLGYRSSTGPGWLRLAVSAAVASTAVPIALMLLACGFPRAEAILRFGMASLALLVVALVLWIGVFYAYDLHERRAWRDEPAGLGLTPETDV